MIASAMGYAVLSALLFALAALPAERLLAETGRPRRIACLAAFVAALAVPAVALLFAPAAPPGAIEAPPLWTFAPAAFPDLGFPTDTDRVGLDALLLGSWAAASAALLLWLAMAWVRLRLAARRWAVVETEHGRIRVADSVGPAVFGMRKPSIVVPRALLDARTATRDIVLAHELEHVAARDHVLVITTRLATALLPWNLPLWWLARRLRTAIEMDCDARVLRRGLEPEAYCEVLLEMGRQRTRAPLISATMLEPKSELERRIRAMVIPKLPASRRRVVALLAMAALFSACATQLEPPAIGGQSSGTPPSGILDQLIAHGSEITSRTINVYGPGVALAPGIVSDREVVLLNGDVTIRVPVTLDIEGASEKLTRSTDGESFVLKNVRLSRHGFTLTSPRAVVRFVGGESTIITMDSAALARAE